MFERIFGRNNHRYETVYGTTYMVRENVKAKEVHPDDMVLIVEDTACVQGYVTAKHENGNVVVGSPFLKDGVINHNYKFRKVSCPHFNNR